MGPLQKRALVFTLIVALVFIPFAGTALAEENYMEEEIGAEKVIADLLVVRPISFLSTVAGTVLYVISLPFSFSEKDMDGNRTVMKENLEKLMFDPARYTFHRRLGDF